MAALSYLKDKDFLRALDNTTNKFYWVKIEILDMDELPLQSVEGKIVPGSVINLSGDSSVRRTCNINFCPEKEETDITSLDSLLSVNKKVRIFEGIKNTVNNIYDDVIWFPLGIFVIDQVTVNHSESGYSISLSCKDKMCLLNGEHGGNLPTSITFHEYDQIIGLQEMEEDPEFIIDETFEPNNYTIYAYGNPKKYKSWSKREGWQTESDASRVGERTHVPQLIYDIIQTLVCNYGGEALSKIFINDVPLEIKQLIRFTGSGTLYYNSATGFYTTDQNYVDNGSQGDWRAFNFNEDIGYVYTDFVYPGELVSGIGDNVCSVLDQIKATLGNYEYFYDLDGNFVFQEVKNYLNNSYDPVLEYEYDQATNRKIPILNEGLSIINNDNYEVDFYTNNKTVYTFDEGNGLISSVTNTPNYQNLKNDFHIWGEDAEGYAIHYHLAIKKKPSEMNTYYVEYITDKSGEYTGGIKLAAEGGEAYTPTDWRAELYLRGLEKQKNGIRPDIYEQELLDLFDMIYDFQKKSFKVDIVDHPNDLQYFIDYLEPTDKLYDYSVDVINTRIYSYQEDKIRKLYNGDVPNMILISLGFDDDVRNKMIDRCEREGQPYSNVDAKLYSFFAEGTIGYTAQEVARDLLYQYTNYNESISIQCVPIYYLDVNSRITVQDKKADIYGDFIIKNISLPLDAGSTMSITAVRALERI